MRIIRISKIITIVLFLLSILSISAQNGKTLVAFDTNIEAGKIAETEPDLFKYVIANPKDATGFSLLAKLRFKQGRFNEAKALANRALRLDSKLLSAKTTLCESHIQTHGFDEARSVLDTISTSEIKDISTILKLAKIYANIGNCPKALSITDKLTINLKNTTALPLRGECFLLTKDVKNFTLSITTAKGLTKSNSPLAVEFAGILSKAKLDKETVDLLRLAIASSPTNAIALLLLAKSEVFLKDLVNAKIHLTKAEKLDSNSAELAFVKSLVESEQNDNKKALELLAISLTANPNNTEYLSQYVLVAMRAGIPANAVRGAERLLELQPENLDFIYLYGAAALQNNNLTSAEAALNKFFEARPNDARGCLALGLTLAAQPDRIELARNQMQKCLTINPNNFEATYQLGLSYKTNGEAAKAVEYLEKTVKLSPNYASALRDLGAVYLQTNNEAKARQILEKAVSLNPNDADTHFQLSRLYNLIGERELAKKHLEVFQKLKNPKKDGM
jgi:tetratricopeptide (TPR) repeat protein